MSCLAVEGNISEMLMFHRFGKREGRGGEGSWLGTSAKSLSVVTCCLMALGFNFSSAERALVLAAAVDRLYHDHDLGFPRNFTPLFRTGCNMTLSKVREIHKFMLPCAMRTLKVNHSPSASNR